GPLSPDKPLQLAYRPRRCAGFVLNAARGCRPDPPAPKLRQARGTGMQAAAPQSATDRDRVANRAARHMTFAVIKTGGKQYKVAANDVIKIEKLDAEAGDL